MYELNLEEMEAYRQLRFPKQVLSISVPDMVMERSESEYRGDREKSSAMMRDEVAVNNREIATASARMAKKMHAHFSRYLPPPDSLLAAGAHAENPLALPLQASPLLAENQRLRQEITADLSFVRGLDRKNYQLLVEIHKKYSIPVACLIFVLVGAPLGMMARRGSMAMAAGISFSFFLLYWASLIGGEELADEQLISPFMAMWLANIIVGIAGIYLVLYAVRESTIFNPETIRNFFNRIRTIAGVAATEENGKT